VQLDGDRGEGSVSLPVLWSLILGALSLLNGTRKGRRGVETSLFSSPSADVVPAAVGSVAFGPAVCLPGVGCASWQHGRIPISRMAGRG
jgi:hypothetical protein